MIQSQSRWVFSSCGGSQWSREIKIQPRSLWSSLVEVVMGELVPQEVPDVKPDKRRKMENTRVQQLGDDPRKVLSEARKDILILHRLGACFRVPGIDYLRFRFSGTEMPSGSEFHQVCSLCAVDRAERGSSGTQTSCSTDEE